MVIVLSISGLLNTLTMVPTLVQHSVQWRARFRNSPFILAGFLFYSYETYYAVRLLQSPTDSSALTALTDLLIIIAVYGVARAWELVGIRQFQVQDWLSSFGATKKQENASNTNAANSVTDIKKDAS